MQERAQNIIDTGSISLDSKLGVFLVNGSRQEARVVRLFPKQSCSCPATALCYHVKAAQLAVGFRDAPARRKINITELRKNKRKKIDKTSGRKRPRSNDIDVIPAGDYGTIKYVLHASNKPTERCIMTITRQK